MALLLGAAAVTVADRQLSGPEAAALYERLSAELRERSDRQQRSRRRVAQYLIQHQGRASLADVLSGTGMQLGELLPVLNELLQDGQVQEQGTLLILVESPGSTA